MDAAEIKQKIESQKKISFAMKKALFDNKDEFTVDNKRFVKHGNTFVETEPALSPKEKLQAKLTKEQKSVNKNLEM